VGTAGRRLGRSRAAVAAAALVATFGLAALALRGTALRGAAPGRVAGPALLAHAGHLDTTMLDAEPGGYYIFLQVFRLQGSSVAGIGGFYHSEVLVCPRSQFPLRDQEYLDGLDLSQQDFYEMSEDWWRSSQVKCAEIAYGGAEDSAVCSGVMLRKQQPLADSEALILNVDSGVAWKYFYGVGDKSLRDISESQCSGACGQQWAGSSYGLTTHNCNTFTSAILHCVYGLSQSKPGLGVSDMATITCPCSASVMPGSRRL